MPTVLSPSGLETADYNQPEWVAIYNKNIERLNNALLKIQALFDVDIDAIEDGAVLLWDASRSEWRPYKWDV